MSNIVEFEGGFRFSPATLMSIHRELFQGGVFEKEKWVGVFRYVNISKPEVILNGNSVQYADFSMIRDTLKYDFEEEAKFSYKLPLDETQVSNLEKFTSNIWQTHPFREGNTRTIATFIILYLNNIGIEIGNEPFKEHALYFRNAFVRSNYSSVKDNIVAEPKYLHMFFENVLLGKSHRLNNDDLKAYR